MRISTLSRTVVRIGVAAVFLGGAVLAFAHSAWLAPAPGKVRAGSPVAVVLASGHSFPRSEEPVKGLDLKMKVIAPDGKTEVVGTADKGRGLEASFPTSSEGLYRAVIEYDRGIISQTSEGWKPGGRSNYPSARSVIKSYNSFICAVRTLKAGPAAPAPLGLAFELSWKAEGGRLAVMATDRGRPVASAEISAVFGSGDIKPIGKTDASGRLTIEVPVDFHGPVLLTGAISKEMPAGSDYDAERSSSTYYFTWD
jgi:uncharacterized GH25 family protein